MDVAVERAAGAASRGGLGADFRHLPRPSAPTGRPWQPGDAAGRRCAGGLARRPAAHRRGGQAERRIRGELDHFGAMGSLPGLLEVLRDAGHPGLLLVLDEVETLQRVRGDVRDKALDALRQLLDEIGAGRYPGLLLIITGTPGVLRRSRRRPRCRRWPRLATDFSTDPRFDNPRAVQLRLPGFNRDALLALGAKVRDLYADGRPSPTALSRSSTTRTSASRGRDHGVAGREGRCRAASVPEETRYGHPGPGRPVRRLRPAPPLRADPDS